MKLYRIAPLLAFAAATALPASAQLCGGSSCSWTQAAPASSSYTTSYASSYSSGYDSSVRMDGLAADEYLCPTDCATSVNVPAGGRVIDCFKVCKKSAPAPVYQTVTQAYQVVRPVVYVNYPVPVALPSCPIYDAPSRYGSRYGYAQGGCR